LEGWERDYNSAKENVQQFLDDFSAVGSDEEGATILVTTLTDDYSSAPLSGYLAEADTLLGDAGLEAPSGSSERKRIDRLRDETTALSALSTCQDSLWDLYSMLVERLDDYQNGQSYNYELDDAHSDTQSEADEFSNLVEDLNPIVGSQYTEKVDQLNTELDVIDDLISGIIVLFSARDSYDDEIYGIAYDRAQSARRDFESAVEEIEDPESYPPTDQVDEEFLDHAEEWLSEAEDIEQSSLGRQTEDE
jgi:hypothetical protein